jgi:uncharacterized protein YbjT (DUF2867 family)
MTTTKTALVLGATGLIGGELLKLLLADPMYAHVTALVRKLTFEPQSKLNQQVVDFDQLNAHADLFAVDEVFCCLGTTIKKAGSQEAFRKVDFAYPLEAARLAVAKGVRQFLLITALGADKSSSVFYNRVKGEVEEEISKLHLPALHIFRPSLLLGERQEVRIGETVGKVVATGISFLLVGGLKKYKPIQGRTVAKAMVAVAQKNLTGKHVVESGEIQALGQ